MRPGGEPGLAALAVAAAAGFAIAAYLTTVHYAPIPLACSVNAVVNCAEVTSSSFSVVPGTQLPITIPGMAWFAVSGILTGIAWRLGSGSLLEPTWLRPLHLIWGLIGLVAVIYLLYAEIVALHRICEWCTAVHVLILVTVLIALRRLQLRVGAASG